MMPHSQGDNLWDNQGFYLDPGSSLEKRNFALVGMLVLVLLILCRGLRCDQELFFFFFATMPRAGLGSLFWLFLWHIKARNRPVFPFKPPLRG